MTIKSTCELVYESLNTHADLLMEKAVKGKRDRDTNLQLIEAAHDLRDVADRVAMIGGDQR